VEESDALTPAGVAVAAGLRQTTDHLLAEPVSPEADRAAERKLDDVRRHWVTRNRVAA
jgi:hypothetical protein